MRTTTITLTRPNTDIPWHEMSTEHWNYLKANFIDEYTVVLEDGDDLLLDGTDGSSSDAGDNLKTETGGKLYGDPSNTDRRSVYGIEPESDDGLTLTILNHFTNAGLEEWDPDSVHVAMVNAYRAYYDNIANGRPGGGAGNCTTYRIEHREDKVWSWIEDDYIVMDRSAADGSDAGDNIILEDSGDDVVSDEGTHDWQFSDEASIVRL